MVKTFLINLLKNDIGSSKIFWKNTTGQRNDYTVVSLLNYQYFKENSKLIAIYLSKQEAFNADSKEILEIKFNGNLKCAESRAMFLITEDFSRFLKRNCIHWN